ncbi:hypothetical protein F5X96DRAFT_647967 [Biscogniauxia mediterranea]|nr:hypothetical protein F5X96DRAFT_647967 [Biscogniauxia mediterranea]
MYSIGPLRTLFFFPFFSSSFFFFSILTLPFESSFFLSPCFLRNLFRTQTSRYRCCSFFRGCSLRFGLPLREGKKTREAGRQVGKQAGWLECKPIFPLYPLFLLSLSLSLSLSFSILLLLFFLRNRNPLRSRFVHWREVCHSRPAIEPEAERDVSFSA